MILLSGNSNIGLSKEIAAFLGLECYYPCTMFSDGEISVQIPINIRKKDVFVIQSTSSNVNNNLMELMLMIDAAKRASAGYITAVIPYFGYSRQDRKDKTRVPISARLVADMLKVAGVNRILTVDIHSDQEQGFFDGTWDNLFASYVLQPIIKNLDLDNLVIVSPDKGGVKRATVYARKLQAESIAIVYKERDTNLKNQSKALDMIGTVDGKNCVIVDDIIDTGGSIVNAANLLKARGANSIYVAATHGIFSADAIKNLNESIVKKIYITNSIAQKYSIEIEKIEVVSIGYLLSQAIEKIAHGDSISSVLLD